MDKLPALPTCKIEQGADCDEAKVNSLSTSFGSAQSAVDDVLVRESWALPLASYSGSNLWEASDASSPSSAATVPFDALFAANDYMTYDCLPDICFPAGELES